MPLSRAEIQKGYRERKKAKEGESYLRKERTRRMKYYVPSAELSTKERKRRNKQNAERVKKHREKRKTEVLQAEEDNIGETSGYESNLTATGEERQLIVRMNFSSSKKGSARKRISRAVSKAHREINHLKAKNNEMKKKIRKLQKRNERLQKQKQGGVSPQTPRSKTDRDLREAGISPNRGKAVKRKLLLGNALLCEIKEANLKAGSSTVKKQMLQAIASGNTLKRYKGLKWLGRKTGMNRNKLGHTVKKWIDIGRKSRRRVQERYKKDVVSFLERDDNSRAQPGKADAKKIESGEKIQTRVLTDYLSNLHQKFIMEHPNVELSLATFCRMRPKHILNTSMISRSCCLCTKHQNMALLLRCLKSNGIQVPLNPESFMKQTDQPNLQDKLPDDVKYSQWKRIEVTEKGKTKNVTRIVELNAEKKLFIESFQAQLKEFESHVFRVRRQYQEIESLKDKLPKHHFIVQMDFAENYSCKSNEEIQSAYWNMTSVTLHPIVVYFMNTDMKLEHQSFVVVSDELSHSAITVHGILEKMIPKLKEIDEDVEMIHYWTDGPTSQYRNKQVFFTIANHKEIFGVQARWNYFEAGHGKGPCDGLGGTTKRMADEAVRSGRTVIQHADDFFKWAVESNLKGIKFLFVSSDECKSAANILSARNVKPLQGTFKVHAVIGKGNSIVAWNEVSCHCDQCFLGDNPNFDHGWKVQSLNNRTNNLKINTGEDDKLAEEADKVMEQPPTTNERKIDLIEGEYVAAKYDRTWYIAKILQIDDSDEVEVTFMERKKQLFQWPAREDILWIPVTDVICKVTEPVYTGKSKRMLKLLPEDKEKILNLFQ